MISNILKGWLFWQEVRIRYFVSYSKAIIVLSGENHELDRQILLFLPEFRNRKHVNQIIVLCNENNLIEWSAIISNYDFAIIHEMSENDMGKLYDYYSFIKFFDNIVFTYTDKPADNLLGKYLRETAINEKDAACLALYHLRLVPEVRR